VRTVYITIEPDDGDGGLARAGYAVRGGSLEALDDGQLEINVEDPSDTEEVDEAVREALRELDLRPGDYRWDPDAVREA
jgi:hypothetical protein